MADIKEILNQQGINYKETNNPSQILIKCTSGTHNDINPSLSFDIDRNIFQCWSCGFKGGALQFLQSIGITEKLYFETKQPHKINKLKIKLSEISNKGEIQLPVSTYNITADIKGISKSVLEEFGAFLTTEMNLENYVCFPVKQFGKIKFIEGRYAGVEENKPKYIRKPAYAPALTTLFPLDKIKGNSVILVEGIFDMLNLYQYGYTNTLCIFGTNNFGKKKVELLNNIGITNVKVFMDGDTPGRIAAKKIVELLEKENIRTDIITLPEDKDPGCLTKNELEFYLPCEN